MHLAALGGTAGILQCKESIRANRQPARLPLMCKGNRIKQLLTLLPTGKLNGLAGGGGDSKCRVDVGNEKLVFEKKVFEFVVTGVGIKCRIRGNTVFHQDRDSLSAGRVDVLVGGHHDAGKIVEVKKPGYAPVQSFRVAGREGCQMING